MQRFEKRRPQVTVRREWLDWYRKRGANARFWWRVGRLVRERRVAHAEKERILAICREVDRTDLV